MMRKKKWRVFCLRAIIAFAIAYIALFAAVHICSTREYPQVNADVIIVLGARVMPDGELSTTLEYRIRSAYEAYEKGLAGAFIVTGAQGADEPVTEARAMADYLLSRGVDEANIYMDDKSTDTIENMSNAKAIMEENGFEDALIVTSDYHMTRAVWLTRQVGIDATGYPAPGPDLLHNRIIARLRESLAWVKYLLVYGL
ncbi:MAG: YdcF family protein [Clostridia bacterium]|nr:YdcF family protein [Clostridia bacterium]